MSRIFPRTRTGCLACRQRKKKCDEAKPQCQACKRNKLDCSWPPHIRRRLGLDSEQENPDSGHCHTLVTTEKHCTEALAGSVSISPTGAVCPVLTDNAEDNVVAWSWGLKTFLGPVRAGLLSPASNTMLSHYIEFTAPKLAPTPDAPFVSWVLPLAYQDDLLMHSILALGGAHLSYRLQGNIDVQQATCRHYSLAVRTLRRMSEDETLLREPLALLRVILTVMVLCHYEVISGNLDGSPFTHVRASRHLLLELRKRRDQIKTASELRLYGFLMEIYSYIVLCNTITPFGMNYNRMLVHDPFLQSIDELRDLGAFGVMFCGGHILFEMISSISFFAAHQESPPSVGDNTDPGRYELYKRLKTRIINWSLSSPGSSDSDLLSERKATLEVCRQALLIFLETAISPFSKRDSSRIYHLQPLLDVAMAYLPQIIPSKYSCIIMWPIMIIGSCLIKEQQRMTLTDVLINNHYMMRQTAQAGNLLELLWGDPDQYAIGPYGLGLVMAKHGIYYGLI